MEIIKKFKKGNKVLEVYQDESPESPREWDNLGRMICFHNKYNLGDKTDFKDSDFKNWEEMSTHLVNTEKAVVLLPLYLYDHSGITIATTPFRCKWDSGQVGFIYCTKEDLEEAGIEQESKAKDILIGEVKNYDSYISGGVYRYTENEMTTCKCCNQEIIKELDSCSGYYDIKDIISEKDYDEIDEVE